MDIRRARAQANANKAVINGSVKPYLPTRSNVQGSQLPPPVGSSNKSSVVIGASEWTPLAPNNDPPKSGFILPPGVQLPQPQVNDNPYSSSSSIPLPSPSSSVGVGVGTQNRNKSSSVPHFNGYPLSLQRFQQIKILGQGSFGIAYLVKDTLQEEYPTFVIKRIDISSMDTKTKRAALGEVEVLSRLSHPNICAYYGSWIEGNPTYLHILLEYCNGGDLQQAIKTARTNKKFFSEPIIMTWFVQLSSAIYYCHNRRILHRDLKASNIFLQGPARIIKLADFGIARVLHSEGSMASTVIGTPYYMSPELCSNEQYSYKSDVWSLGCVLYEMCTLKHAFDAGNMCALVLSILRGKYPPLPTHYSGPLSILVDSMLQLDPGRRPTMAEIIGTTIVQTSLKQTAKKEDHAGRKYFARAHDTLVHSVQATGSSSNSQGENNTHATGIAEENETDEETYSDDNNTTDDNDETDSDNEEATTDKNAVGSVKNNIPSSTLLLPPSVHNITHSNSLYRNENTNESDPGLMYAIDARNGARNGSSSIPSSNVSVIHSGNGYSNPIVGGNSSRLIPPSVRGAARQLVPNIDELDNEEDNEEEDKTKEYPLIHPSKIVSSEHADTGLIEDDGGDDGVSYPDSQANRSARPLSSNPSEEDNTGWGTLNEENALSPSGQEPRLMKPSYDSRYHGLANDSLGSAVATVGQSIGQVTLPNETYNSVELFNPVPNAPPLAASRPLYVLPLAANVSSVAARSPPVPSSVVDHHHSNNKHGGARQILSDHHASKANPLHAPKMVPFRASAPATSTPSTDVTNGNTNIAIGSNAVNNSVQSPLRIVSAAQALENRRLAHAQYEQKREQLRRKQMLMANRLRSPPTNVTSPVTATPPNSVASSIPLSMESTPGNDGNSARNDESSNTSDGAFSISIDTNAVERILNHVAQSSPSTANGTAAALQVALARAAIAQGHISADQTGEFLNTQEANHHSELLQQAQLRRANIGMFALSSNDQLLGSDAIENGEVISVRIPGLPLSPSSVPSSIDSVPSSSSSSSSSLVSLETVPTKATVIPKENNGVSGEVQLTLPPTLEQRQRRGVGLKRESVAHLSNELNVHHNSLSRSQDPLVRKEPYENGHEGIHSSHIHHPSTVSVTPVGQGLPKPTMIPSPRYSAQPLLARRFGQPPPPNHQLGMIMNKVAPPLQKPISNGPSIAKPIHQRQLSNQSNGVSKRIIAIESDSDDEEVHRTTNHLHHTHHEQESTDTTAVHPPVPLTQRIIGRKAGNASRRPTASDKLLADVRDLQMVMAAAVAEAEQQKKDTVFVHSQVSIHSVTSSDTNAESDIQSQSTDTNNNTKKTVPPVSDPLLLSSNNNNTSTVTDPTSITKPITLTIDTSNGKIESIPDVYTDTDYDSDSTSTSFDNTGDITDKQLSHHRRTSSLRAPGFRPLLFDARSVSISSGTNYTSSTHSIEILSTTSNAANDNEDTNTLSRDRRLTVDTSSSSVSRSLTSPRTHSTGSPSHSGTPRDENNSTLVNLSIVSAKVENDNALVHASSDAFILLPLGTSFPSPGGPSGILYVDPRKGLQRSPLHNHNNSSSLRRALSGYATVNKHDTNNDNTEVSMDGTNVAAQPLANRAIAMMNSVMERHIDRRKSFRSNGSNSNLASLVPPNETSSSTTVPSVPSVLTDLSPNTTMMNVSSVFTPQNHENNNDYSNNLPIASQAISSALKSSTPTSIQCPTNTLVSGSTKANVPLSTSSVPTGSRRSSWESKRLSWGQAQRELAAAATHLEIARNLREMLSLSTNGTNNNKDDTPSPLTDFTSPPPNQEESSMDTNSSILIHSSESSSSSLSNREDYTNGPDPVTNITPLHTPHNLMAHLRSNGNISGHSRLSTLFHKNGVPSNCGSNNNNNSPSNKGIVYRNSPKALRRHSTGSSPMLILRSGSKDHLDSQRITEVDNDDEDNDHDDSLIDENEDNNDNKSNDDDEETNDNHTKVSSGQPSSTAVNSTTEAKLETQIRQRMDSLRSYCIQSLGSEKYTTVVQLLRSVSSPTGSTDDINSNNNNSTKPTDEFSPEPSRDENKGPDPIAKIIQDIGPQLVMRLQLLLAYEEEAKIVAQ